MVCARPSGLRPGNPCQFTAKSRTLKRCLELTPYLQGGHMSTASPALSFPGETAEYRKARNELLVAEIELRRSIEAVAAARRKLPLGGQVAQDYVFDEGPSDLSQTSPLGNTRLSELFDAGKDTLLIYSYMYGPAMATPCTSCTSILDGLNGTAPHVRDRINFVVVAKSPIERIRATAKERGWHNLRLLSSAGNSYNLDYRGENKEGGQLPSLNVFVR